MSQKILVGNGRLYKHGKFVQEVEYELSVRVGNDGRQIVVGQLINLNREAQKGIEGKRVSLQIEGGWRVDAHALWLTSTDLEQGICRIHVRPVKNSVVINRVVFFLGLVLFAALFVAVAAYYQWQVWQIVVVGLIPIMGLLFLFYLAGDR